MAKRSWEDELPDSCSCWRSAPCSYCMATAECQGCGVLFFVEDVFRYRRKHEEFPLCDACQEKYRHILEGHELDCVCRACMAFVNESNPEEGFKAAIPIMIEMEGR